MIGIEITVMEFCSEGERVQLGIQHSQVGIYIQGTGWGSVDGKLLRVNMRSKGGESATLT